MKKLNSYDLLSLLLILLITLVTLSRFDIFPVFVDIYYHLSVTLSFEKAGGIVLWDFWEFAPEGRPHLYPPLLHALMLFLSEGTDLVSVGKFISFIMFPASQVTLWFSTREIFSQKTGFYSLLVLSSSIPYFRAQAITSAAALVLVFTPLVFYVYEKRRYVSAALLLALCLYTHVSMGPIALASFALYALFRRDNTKKAAQVILISVLLYAPWGLHVLSHTENLSSVPYAFAGGTLMVFPWVLGIVGLLICVRERGEYLIPVCIFVSMLPIAFTYIGRFTSHSILPLAMLSGVALSSADEKLANKQKLVFIAASLFILSLFAPTLSFPKKGITVQSSSFLASLPGMKSDSYLTQDNLSMTAIILQNSQPNEIIFPPGGVMGCFVTATTGRPQTSGMWQEVAADEEPDPRSASLFVLPRQKKAPKALVVIGETEKYVILRASEKRTVDEPSAAVGKGVVYALLVAAFVVFLVDGLRKPFKPFHQ